MSDILSERLDLRGVRVLEVLEDSVDRLVVEVDRPGIGLGAGRAGSSADGCGTGGRSGSVT